MADVPWNEVWNPVANPDSLEKPLHWRKPRIVLVEELFHAPPDRIDKALAMMALLSKHTFVVITAQPERMKQFAEKFKNQRLGMTGRTVEEMGAWPCKRVWLGVTVENQEAADERIPILLQIPAAVRFVSCEPLLSAIDLTKWLGGKNVNDGSDHNTGHLPSQDMETSPRGIDWCIVGGETGPNARPVHPDWVRSLRDQCQTAGTPFWFCGWGEWRDYNELVSPEMSAWNHERRAIDRLRYCYVTPEGKVDRVARFGSARMVRVGKKKAGRLLDGREWNELPEVAKE